MEDTLAWASHGRKAGLFAGNIAWAWPRDVFQRSLQNSKSLQLCEKLLAGASLASSFRRVRRMNPLNKGFYWSGRLERISAIFDRMDSGTRRCSVILFGPFCGLSLTPGQRAKELPLMRGMHIIALVLQTELMSFIGQCLDASRPCPFAPLFCFPVPMGPAIENALRTFFGLFAWLAPYQQCSIQAPIFKMLLDCLPHPLLCCWAFL